MYTVEETSYGFRVTSSGVVDKVEAEQLRSELMQLMALQSGSFSLIADLRAMIPSKPEVVEVIAKMQAVCKLMSLKRAAVVVASPEVTAQMKHSAFRAGTGNIDRFIDASRSENWEAQALAWVQDAVEPEDTPVSESQR